MPMKPQMFDYILFAILGLPCLFALWDLLRTRNAVEMAGKDTVPGWRQNNADGLDGPR